MALLTISVSFPTKSRFSATLYHGRGSSFCFSIRKSNIMMCVMLQACGAASADGAQNVVGCDGFLLSYHTAPHAGSCIVHAGSVHVITACICIYFYLYLYVYVCEYLSDICMCMYVCVCIDICMYMHAHTHRHSHTHTHTNRHTHPRTYISIQYAHVYMCIYYVFMYTYMFTFMNI